MALDQTTASDRKRARDSETAQRARAGAANAEQETKAVGAVHKGRAGGSRRAVDAAALTAAGKES